MKRLLLLAFALIGFCSISNAQSDTFVNGLVFKKLFLDYQSQNGGDIGAFKNYHHGFEIGFQRNLANRLNLVVPFKYGQVNATNIDSSYCLHKKVAGLDVQFQYLLKQKGSRFNPYLMAGVGGVLEFEGDFNAQVPLGVGLYIKTHEKAYINIQSEYRYSFAENRNNLHHGIGFVYLFGGGKKDAMPKIEAPKVMLDNVDSDGDGIENKLDLCPDQPGAPIHKGCPDTDGDGVPDFQDGCPEIVGPKVYKGCPDADGDGIPDNDDECPNVPGLLSAKGCPSADRDMDGVNDDVDKCPDIKGLVDNMGCPPAVSKDQDGDGIEDSMDKCPSSKGTKEMGGCPDSDRDGIADPDDQCPTKFGIAAYGGCPDTDGDGMPDNIDKCINTPGSVDNGGCPEIAQEDKQTLDIAMRAVQFDTGRATFKQESYAILNQIADIMRKYSDYNLSISGHTDNTGNAVANQDLSEKRAKACYDYLISKGISVSRLSYAGYGESRPVSDNTTENGKKLNRRVEFNLVIK